MQPRQPCQRSALLNALRLKTGTVIVKLSRNPSEWLILEKDQLGIASPMLFDSLKPSWGAKPVLIPHPLTGAQTWMFILSLIWDGNSFALRPVGDEHFVEYPPPTSPMSPKFLSTTFDFERDALVDDVHPGVLAAHDIFNMFAIMFNLAVHLDHLPLYEHDDPEDVIRLGIPRIASIITHVQYYTSGAPQQYRLQVLKNLLMEYALAYRPDNDQDSAWTEVLRFSRDLKFPELYICVLLKFAERGWNADICESLAEVLELGSAREAHDLLMNVRNNCYDAYKDRIGMIVNIPLLALTDHRAFPRDVEDRERVLPDQVADQLDLNARVMAGMIWEAQMRKWMHWRGLTWHESGTVLNGENHGIDWRQRYPWRGVNQGKPCNWKGEYKTIVGEDVPDEVLLPGQIKESVLYESSLTYCLETVIPTLHKAVGRDHLENAKDMWELILLPPGVIRSFLDTEYQHDQNLLYLDTPRLLDEELTMLTWPMSENWHGAPTEESQHHEDAFIENVRKALRSYVHVADTILRSALRPPDGLWDLEYTGSEFTWAIGWADPELDRMQALLDDENAELLGIIVDDYDSDFE